MYLKYIMKAFSGDLSVALKNQIRSHQETRSSFHSNIICGLSEDSEKVSIYATLKSNNPNKGVHTNQQIVFYRSKVISIEEGLHQLTTEVSQAKIRFPAFDFYRSLVLPLGDVENYKTHSDKLHDFEKMEIISRGIYCNSNTLNIYEVYTIGGWHSYDRFPWHTSYDDGDETDEFGEFRV